MAITIYDHNTRLMMLRMSNDFFINGVNIFTTILPIGNPMTQLQNIRTWHIPSPVVNICFAIELSLKALLPNPPKDKKGHDLYHLYTMLDPAYSVRIEDHFGCCKTYSYPFIDLVLSEQTRPDLPLGSSNKEIIENTLKRCKDNFVDFRYMFEMKKDYLYFDSNFLIRIAHSCILILAENLMFPFKELQKPNTVQTSSHTN